MPKKTKDRKDPYFQRESTRYDSPIASREYLLQLIGEQQVPVSLEHIAADLGYNQETQLEALRRRLNAMARDGQVFRNRRGGFLSFDHMDLARGVVQTHPDGFGFLTPETGGKDIFLPEREMRSLMSGDRVAVKLVSYDARRERSEGSVISVLERAHETVVGRYYRESGIDFVVPDDKRLVQDILLNRDVGHVAKPGEIVLVRITEFPNVQHQPIGVIERVLGEENAPGMEVTIAVNTHHIPHQWNEAVQAESEILSEKVAESDKQNRRDLRQLAFVTIDGADARDFDDAVYCEPLENEGYRLYVAIADVAHYVRPGSALDDEAQTRGTSVYFPGEVIPMLPEVLSNGLCSLNPEVDRLCLVCAMDVTPAGKIIKFEFFEAVIHSHARLIYDDVAAFIFDGKPPPAGRLRQLDNELFRLKSVYQALAKARQRRHAIEFETREVIFHYDDNRKIDSIEPYARNEAHMLIEECMIAANICAAKWLKKLKLPTLYRNHEGPNPKKLDNLAEFLAAFSIRLTSEKPTPRDYADIIEQARLRDEFDMIQLVVLRSLMQACYSPDPKIGHFGLALDDYAHFTSPIRRYPDLLVHRAIKHVLQGGTASNFSYTASNMDSLGESCSRFERRAEEATRDAADWLKCDFLQKHVGNRYLGTVSAVTNFGLFVQLDDLLIDGLVHVTSLKRDYYHYDQAHHRLVGELTNINYRLGDRLEVEVEGVNMEERKIDFGLVRSLSEKPAKKVKKQKQKSANKGAGKKKPKTTRKRKQRR